MTETVGRGAWNSKGVGGTLKYDAKKKRIVPGPYYMKHSDPNQTIGLRAVLLKAAGRPQEIGLDYLATWHGVIGIQALAANFLARPVYLDGLFDKKTHDAVTEVQRKANLIQDGIVGKTTMKVMLLPLVALASKAANVNPQIVMGFLANEGAFDPGAVGVLDANDIGLAQINLIANPHVTLSDAFCPSFSVKYVANRFAYALATFGNEDDAIASYNLGVAGTREWIKAGRPDIWTPSWATAPRNTRKYIDTIKG